MGKMYSVAFLFVSIKVIFGCISKNSEKYGSSVITLDGTEFVDSNQSINLTCSTVAQGHYQPNIEWFHRGIGIKHSDKKWQNRLIITRFLEENYCILKSHLIIEHSTLRDSGTYICKMAEEAASITVHVLLSHRNRKRPIITNSPPHKASGYNSSAVSLQIQLLPFIARMILLHLISWTN